MSTIILSLLLSFFSCTPDQAADTPEQMVLYSAPSYQFAYDLTEPEETWELPGKMEEISGLTLSPDGKHLIAIDDEDGELYFISKKSGKLKAEIDFWRDGDYEGVELVDNGRIFVVKSKGTLYEINNVAEDGQQTTVHQTFLSETNDVEGLAYDAANNRLLLGCKGLAGKGNAFQQKKAVYAFDLSTNKLQPEPVALISQEAVQRFLELNPLMEEVEKITEFFDPAGGDFSFSPSGIAIEPGTGNLFIISSRGKMLMVTDPNGTILYLEKMKKKVHRQPEGIVFDGDMLYISNEAKSGDDANIHRFERLRQ